MSRIDDDRDAQRLLERQALKQREEARRANDRTTEGSAFARLVSQETAPQKEAPVPVAEEPFWADDDLTQTEAQGVARALEGAVEEQEEDARDATARAATGRAQSKVSRPSRESSEQEQSRGEEPGQAAADRQLLQRGREGRAAATRALNEKALRSGVADAGLAARHTQRTRDDARSGAGVESRRVADRSAAAKSTPEGLLPNAEEEARAHAQDGGHQGGQQPKDDGQPGGGALGYRLNPALLAPVPVAQPKDAAGRGRLRALAAEIAQKIVERVRVGTNKEGQAEFQIDLRSSVLNGLSIKLTGSNGRIRALFSGRDKGVLEQLEAQKEGLKQALERRGLRVEELKIERLA